VVCAPKGDDIEPLDVELERSLLGTALKPLTDANAVAIDWLEDPTLLGLKRKVRHDEYHIIHFIGHGGFDKASGEGALLFEDDNGRGRTVSGDQLAAVLYGKRSLRLVLLNSCEGARNGVDDPFSGVAASLVEREVPAVIGMQFEITDRAAVLFAGEFYTMLAEGQPIDSAISEARLSIWADSNDVEWGTPVLFMRVPDGRLFDVVHASSLPRLDPEELPPKVDSIADAVPTADTDADAEAPAGLLPTVATVREAPPVTTAPVEPEPAEPAPAEPAPAEPEPVEPEPAKPEPVKPEPVAPEPAEPERVEPEPVEPEPIDVVIPKPKPRPLPRVRRRTIAIGIVAVIALLLVAIRILFPPTSTGSLAVSTDGTLQTGLVFLNGSGFAAGETVDLYLDEAPALTVDAGADGSFEAELDVGTQRTGTVSAVGRDSHSQVNTDFKVEVAGGSGSPTASDSASPGASDTAPATAAPVSPGILFYSDVDHELGKTVGRELYLLDPATGRIDRLTHNEFDDTFPTWSPDYKQIAFCRDVSGNGDIYIRDLRGEEGSERALVTGVTDDWFPAWSKDNVVAFARAGPDNRNSAGLWVIPSDGGESTEVLPGSLGRAPAWSTNGTMLAFMSLRTGTGLDVATIQPDGDGLDLLVATDAQERNPTWSPNGETIVFVSDGDGGDQEIYLLDVATRNVTPPLTVNEVLDGNPVWSPDGTQIAFHRTSDDGYHLWKMNADGSGQRDLMLNARGKNMDPNWR